MRRLACLMEDSHLRTPRCRAAAALAAPLLSAVCALLLAPRPAEALPHFSLQYGVPCSTCHTVAPALNSFGYAFQANHFNWPAGATPEKKRDWLAKIPASFIATGVSERSVTERKTTTAFDGLEVYPSAGFAIRTPGGARAGGYFVDVFAVTQPSDDGPKAGALEDAFVSLPVAGRSGQWALTAGQTTPLMYQYDPVNSLTDSLPLALGDEGAGKGDPLLFTGAAPTARIDFFDRRGTGSPEGNYVTVGVPFAGHLDLNRSAYLRTKDAQGAYVHAFHRWNGRDSVGLFGHVNGGDNTEGLLATYGVVPSVYLLGAASLSKGDATGTARHVSLQADYTPTTRVGVTGRLEYIDASGSEVGGAAGVTYYPLRLQALRISAETAQRKGDRSYSLFLRAQF
jgi:hypothetical protein